MKLTKGTKCDIWVEVNPLCIIYRPEDSYEMRRLPCKGCAITDSHMTITTEANVYLLKHDKNMWILEGAISDE